MSANVFQISTLNMLKTNSAFAVTEGLAYAAPYLYVTPHNGFLIAKIDPKTFTIVDTLDLSKVDSSLTGMLGSYAAHGYLYILPHLSASGDVYQGNVVRVDLANFTPAGCTVLGVLDASQSLTASNGRTDGVYGYINVQVANQAIVTRFGLGKNFNKASISTVSITTIAGYPVLSSNLVAVDKKNVYQIATVVTFPGTGKNDKTMDLWLITTPTDNFTAKAASFQRLTNIPFLGNSVPKVYVAIDDGKNLWCPPMPALNGPMVGQYLGVMQIPKDNPAGVKIYQGPPSQAFPSRASVSGMGIYDGHRYGYLASDTAMQIIQMDFEKPGVVHTIDISAWCAGYPMYGLGYDGKWGYAVSFNGGAGLCLRFHPTPDPHASDCPCCT